MVTRIWIAGSIAAMAWVTALLLLQAQPGRLNGAYQLVSSIVPIGLDRLIRFSVIGMAAWMLLPLPSLTWKRGSFLAVIRGSLLQRIEALWLLALFIAYLVAVVRWGPWRPENAGWVMDGRLHSEDGPLENMTAAFAIGAAVTLFLCLARLGGRSRFLVVALGAMAFVFGMEEISWGQRVFGYATPERLAEINRQGEVTLHNLLSPKVLHNSLPQVVNVLLAVYFAFAAYFSRFFPSELSEITRPEHSPLLSIVFQVLSIHTLLHPGGELTEEVIATVLLFSALRFWNERRGASGRSSPRAA